MRGLPDHDQDPGYIVWPTHWDNTGEGGMAVFVAFLDDGAQWLECAIKLPHLEQHDVYTEGPEFEKSLWPNSRRYTFGDDGDDWCSLPMLAIVCLGSSGGSWRREPQGYFKATIDDLTQDGRAVVDLLRGLYNREPVFITALDT